MLDIHPCALLTGAGFTHNFGAYLATQFWEHIFNQPSVSQSSALQAILKNPRNEYDFELIYGIIRKGNRDIFPLYTAALEAIYSDIDQLVSSSLDQSQTLVDLNAL